MCADAMHAAVMAVDLAKCLCWYIDQSGKPNARFSPSATNGLAVNEIVG